MNTREQFGNYLLLKKLNEDSLGETFRAGRFGNQGIEQVVLLRVLNGTALDGVQVAQRSAGRLNIQEALKNPHLGNGLDFGDLQGVPYLVYDYISGKDLSSLLEQAKRQRMPIPTDHALLIADRMALGLVAGYENRLQGSRILHGFVVPGLVMLSNEGESRLLGFEVAPALRELAPENAALREYERYLSPEALAGQPLSKTDDVYSLGVILYEMLTGERMPAGSISTHESLLANATLANDQEPIPPAIQRLIHQSLAPAGQRIADCVAWHKALSQLMIDGGFNATTFNLAFFMHSLFRDEIERESREIQTEKKIDSPGIALEVPTEAAFAEEGNRGAETVIVNAAAFREEVAQLEPEEEKSRRGLLAGLAALLALAVLGGGIYWFLQQEKGPDPTPPVAAVAAEPVPVEPAGPTQEELQAELDRMRSEMADALVAQSEEMKQSLAEEYEGRIRDLQKQQQDSQKAIEAKRRKEEQQAALASQQAAAEEAARRKAQAAAVAETENLAAANPATSGPDSGSGTGAAPETLASGTVPQEESPAEVASTQPQEEPPAPEPAAPKKAPEPAVRVGQLVQTGPGVTAPNLLRQAQARYPPTALRARRSATIMLRVLVDENGKVVQTEQIGKRAGLGLDEAAATAAKQSTFRPATKNGVRVKMWHSLRYDFQP
ncbi:MAG: TonB family protein [Deltaproteobacteria bacterium]|nr:TonB family protein [Deltaproteobacteria bacterium]